MSITDDNQDEKLEIKVLDPKKPTFTQCSVCETLLVNVIGSTGCCGGISEILWREEVVNLGIPWGITNNTTSQSLDITNPKRLESDSGGS